MQLRDEIDLFVDFLQPEVEQVQKPTWREHLAWSRYAVVPRPEIEFETRQTQFRPLPLPTRCVIAQRNFFQPKRNSRRRRKMSPPATHFTCCLRPGRPSQLHKTLSPGMVRTFTHLSLWCGGTSYYVEYVQNFVPVTVLYL